MPYPPLKLAWRVWILTVASHLTIGGIAQAQDTGIVVERTATGSAGEKSGLRNGDVLTGWTRRTSGTTNAAGGAITSPFDLFELQLEDASRGVTTLLGMRDGRPLAATVPPGSWGIAARPHMVAASLARYAAGLRLMAAGEIEKGAAAWTKLAEDPQNPDGWLVRAWLFQAVGDAYTRAKRSEAAQIAYGKALAIAKDGHQPAVSADIWDSRGRAFARENNAAQAEAAFKEVLAIREAENPDSIVVASTLHDLAVTAHRREDYAAAEAFYRRAFALLERHAPSSLFTATAARNLGLVVQRRGDFKSAETALRQSLTIRESVSPDSVDTADALESLAAVVDRQGDYRESQRLFDRAVAIRERADPNSQTTANTLNDLGVRAGARGNLLQAEELHRRALAIRERLDAESLDVAMSLNNLGNIARRRGDLVTAEELHEKSLALREKNSPASLRVAVSLNNLGNIATHRGDFKTAIVRHRRAIEIKEQLAPDSLTLASSLKNLGRALQMQGDGTASDVLARALAIEQKLAPGTMFVAETLFYTAEIARDRHDYARAVNLLDDSLAISKDLAPGAPVYADALYSRGAIELALGRLAASVEYFREAIDAFEGQSLRLGGAEEVRIGFGSRSADYYRDCGRALHALGRDAEAFAMLERGRARSFLSSLAERDVMFASDLPPEIIETRQRLDVDYDQTQAALARLTRGKNDSEMRRLASRLRELREERERLVQRIRATSPRMAALQYPQPLDLAATQATLEPGSLLLAYSIGPQKSLLFAVRKPREGASPESGLSVFTLEAGDASLAQIVREFRDRIQAPATAASRAVGGLAGRTPLAGPLAADGGRLYQLLIRPAGRLIAASTRVVIIPDGALQSLPFAALIAPAGSGRTQFFIEQKPLHVVVSATVYGELKKGRQPREAAPNGGTIVAFGDPNYIGLAPLPATRKEVARIAQLFGPSAVVHLGDDATEEQARSIPPGVRYIHFASHGLLDERFPMNSAIALSIPERPAPKQQNGLLQTWEVFEYVRLDADLVTLSACETALGQQMAGEGLLGLTRAFQYAGARSVLASLWNVADESTAELMVRFYRHVKAGKPKDVALRSAQLEFLKGVKSAKADYSHPFHWASFQLFGDWH